MSTRRAYILSNGCVPNRLEGKKIVELCRAQGWSLCDNYDQADIIIFNSCGFSGDKIMECKEFISNVLSDPLKGKELILTGCLPAIAPEIPGIGNSFRSLKFSELPTIFKVGTKLDRLDVSGSVRDNLESTRNDTYHLITSQGCMGACSYCAIKRAMGSLKSRPIDIIEQELLDGIKQGYRKFVLWGEDLGAYGFDISTNIIDLLQSLLLRNAYGGKYSLFLHRVNPQWLIRFREEFKEMLRSPSIKLIYSPVQSGSDRILKLMNRFYSSLKARDCLAWIKKEFPNISLKTDIMVGFPTETEDDFEETLAFVRDVRFDEVVVFKYGGIPGTASFEMKGDILDSVKASRVKKFWSTFPHLRLFAEVAQSQVWIVNNETATKSGPYRMSVYSD